MRLAVRLTTALLATVGVCGIVTLSTPTVLRDPPAYAGNALGTYVVLVVVAIPLVAFAMHRAARGSLAARFVWLGDVVPATLSGARPVSLRGTTLPVNVVQVIDFAFTLPVSFAAGVWLWRRRPWGFLLSGMMLVLLLLESVSIAVDQYFGHRADPNQPTGAVVLFTVLSVVGALPTLVFLRSIRSPSVKSRAKGERYATPRSDR